LDLDTQISATFHSHDIANLQAANSRKALQKLLDDDVRKVIITTIHKFGECARRAQRPREHHRPSRRGTSHAGGRPRREDARGAAVFERTREIGMMRAVGMTRAQARRMVRHESVITALIGACLGLPLGVLTAAVATRAMHGAGVTFSLSVPSLIVLALVAVTAGAVAAALPARRASRLNVLQALHYE
jgi:hypothetical protein